MNTNNGDPVSSVEQSAGILARDDGATIAYHALAGKSPGVVFLHGFKSDMTGTKALVLEDFCRRRGNAFVRFDGFGHGGSSGRFEDGTIGRWTDDAVAVLDRVTEGPQVLVGSSMGGWLMLLAALRRRERVAGLVGLAAAPDFTEELVWQRFSDEQRHRMLTEGVVKLPDCYGGDDYPMTRLLIEEGRRHLLLGDNLNLTCPVRLIHGMRDEDVPWETSLRLQRQLASDDVEVTLVKDGGHRLSEPRDLDRLCRVLDALLAQLEG
ncbi:MAG: alpha/beta hydrolase [Rhodospirillales bacterium]|nr:alpha/beta hydrolase [Rhodospirillales bacterium]